MPIALVVKNGSLISQMGVGFAAFKRLYTATQISATILVTFGLLVTIYSNMNPSAIATADKGPDMSIIIPVLLMMGAMTSRALSVEFQQAAFTTYGKQYNEAMFYQHAVALPFIAMGSSNILGQVSTWTLDLWGYLAISMVLNYLVTKACAEVPVILANYRFHYQLVLSSATQSILNPTLVRILIIIVCVGKLPFDASGA